MEYPWVSDDAAKVAIHKIFDGDQLECVRNETIAKLFTRDARDYFKKIENEIKTIVTVDDRMRTIRVQGSARSRTLTFIKINEYLEKMAGSSEKEILLKGNDNPIGLMKALIVQYGTDLGKMKNECGLTSVTLKHRFHSIIINGDERSTEKALSLIESVKENLKSNPQKSMEESLPECPICLCEIELTDLIRLECCGHPYCQPCLKSQVLSAVQDRQFPIVCAVEGCNQTIVLKDVLRQIEKGTLKLMPMAEAAVSCFMGKNKETFRYCITPDCQMVYRVSAEGHQFQCNDCGARVCTSCHLEYHDGLTCATYQNAKTGEGNVDMWIKENPGARKKCPKCQIGIEKIGGCNRMTCSACRSHICWVCFKYFSTAGECYGHLRAAHGSLM